ncbi:MAG: TolC family protein, partial [Paludibacteraceae bacterium]|nr:TolC family protein [Paludibacteraceae bacterium]
PTISASAGLSSGHRNFNDIGNQFIDRFSQNIGVSMSIPIYDRGKTKTSLKMNEAQTKMAEVDLQEAELKLRQTVAVECANVNLAYQQYKVNEKRAKAYKSVYDVYNMKFKYGTVTSVDLLQQQNNYINYLTDYVRSKYSFILERKILDVYMDYPIKYEAVRINK